MLVSASPNRVVSIALGTCLGLFALWNGWTEFRHSGASDVAISSLSPAKPATPGAELVPVADHESAIEDGRFGLAVEVYNSSKSLRRPVEAKALAGAFHQTAEKVLNEKASAWTISGWIKSASAQAISESSQEKWDALQDRLSSKLTSLYWSGKLASAQDWADCFTEIARGLEAASEPAML